MEDVQMEHGFLKAPWEVLVRNFRAGHKPLAKELDGLTVATTALIHRLNVASAPVPVPAQRPALQPADIDALRHKLALVRAKLEQVRASDDVAIERCRTRISHLCARTDPARAAAQLRADAPPGPAAMDVDEPAPARRARDANGRRGAANGDGRAATDDGARGGGGGGDARGEADGDDDGDNGDGDDADDEAASVAEAQARWEKTRLNRALVDYMLREGMYDTAERLSHENDMSTLVDLEIFRESRVVIEALRRRDCSEGLRWCSENKRRLQKVQSKLEFRLRLQEFVELARARRKTDAIAYMKRYLSTGCDAETLIFIQRFMGLLVFDASTACQPYKDMYGEHKWTQLENTFKEENYRLHGLTRESMVELLLKAGLACLKTRKCGTEADRKKTCPTCVEPYLSLAQHLPRGRHENSTLVCSISGAIMDENNPPMALPNGNVYSWKTLHAMAEKNGGVVTDPKTKETARFDELRKCFIM